LDHNLVVLGYVLHHRSDLYDGVRADSYLNDPFVWHDPYLWSFCHARQWPHIEIGTRLYWVSRDNEGEFVCDLVFVVADQIPLATGRRKYGVDRYVEEYHYDPGYEYHKDYAKESGARTRVAHMDASFIPHPAVPITDVIDELRRKENPSAHLLAEAWHGPTAPLRIEDDRNLFEAIWARAAAKMHGALPWPEEGMVERAMTDGGPGHSKHERC
jgi:hypothetical protein